MNRPAIDGGCSDLIEHLPHTRKFGPARIAAVLAADHGIVVAPATVHRILTRRGLNRLTDLDAPTGATLRKVVRSEPGSLIHVDVKKLGRILTGGG
ncbi:hypothetical protein ACFROC_29395 [Nocardia tengchongensis]|uniref:hypothetical protein n=1 Tax=Nocardia tengchongensis TaxID=2055889 RepID=UPI0036AE48E3